MIYIYGGGGRAKLIRELLIRLKIKSKNIIFIDDYEKKYNSTSYLLKNFNRTILSSTSLLAMMNFYIVKKH